MLLGRSVIRRSVRPIRQRNRMLLSSDSVPRKIVQATPPTTLPPGVLYDHHEPMDILMSSGFGVSMIMVFSILKITRVEAPLDASTFVQFVSHWAWDYVGIAAGLGALINAKVIAGKIVSRAMLLEPSKRIAIETHNMFGLRGKPVDYARSDIEKVPTQGSERFFRYYLGKGDQKRIVLVDRRGVNAHPNEAAVAFPGILDAQVASVPSAVKDWKLLRNVGGKTLQETLEFERRLAAPSSSHHHATKAGKKN